ncbi:hypothetical protein FOZ60_011801 [Perkinsus olseni]|uniref:Uncharacterized protein n=1 Tax=Perkinsus olseni TaxID=32597 RepID=A0A7J6PNF2_PEROL|nr:hypothetical protein FOZ60_011801 [Perkinsus olseni]
MDSYGSSPMWHAGLLTLRCLWSLVRPLPDLPVALAMAPPQKQYRTESGGRWKCGVVYRAGTDTADPSVSDAVRAYKVLGQNFTDAVQEDGGCVDNGLHRLLHAAQRTMADSSVVALFRAAVGIRPPERVLAPVAAYAEARDRSTQRKELGPTPGRGLDRMFADCRAVAVRAAAAAAAAKSTGCGVTQVHSTLRLKTRSPGISSKRVQQCCGIPWVRGQERRRGPFCHLGRPRTSSVDNPFIPSPVHLPQRTEPRDPYFYTRRH